jgi:agmatinase
MAIERFSPDEALVLSPWMSVEQLDDAAATIFLSSDGTRLRIPRRLHGLLLRFATAASPRDVCGTSDPEAPALRAMAQLAAKGFLEVPGRAATMPARLVWDPPVRLFDAPAQKLRAAQADIVFLGMPWDFGSFAAAGTRRGPSALREASLQILYGLDRCTGRPLGWFDTDRGRPLLAGVSLADAGDIVVNHGEPRAAAFSRASEVLLTLTRSGALPVSIGGDASTAYPVIELMQRAGPLEVIRIGKSPREGRVFDAPRLTVDSLPGHVLLLPNVVRYVDVVPRGSGQGSGHAPQEYAAVAIDGAAAAISEFGGAPRGNMRVHVGIDVDALAKASDGSSSPSHAYAEVHALLLAIGRAHRIVSVDLCGADPGMACWGTVAMTALHLLLTALGAAKDPA